MLDHGNVRCEECGVLAKREEEQQGSGINSPVEWIPRVSPVSRGEREGINNLPKSVEILCFRDRYNLAAESATVDVDAIRTSGEVLGRNMALARVLSRDRRCEWFEPHRLGLSLEGHIEVQERRREWRRTAIVALSASIIGGSIAMIPALVAILH